MTASIDLAVRMFCTMDRSAYGSSAFSYVKAVVALVGAPNVRLVSAGNLDLFPYDGKETSIWAAYRDLLMTPMTEPHVRIVCCDPANWHRFHAKRSVGCKGNILVATAADRATYADKIKPYDFIFANAPDPALADVLRGVLRSP